MSTTNKFLDSISGLGDALVQKELEPLVADAIGAVDGGCSIEDGREWWIPTEAGPDIRVMDFTKDLSAAYTVAEIGGLFSDKHDVFIFRGRGRNHQWEIHWIKPTANLMNSESVEAPTLPVALCLAVLKLKEDSDD